MSSKQFFPIVAFITRHACRALLTVSGTLLLLSGTSQAQSIIHEFYVPMPEAQVRTALVAIEPAAGIVGTTMESVVSIVATGTGTVVHYDEWEDGYEVDLNHPTQSTTKIWGDGNNANGIPPGYVNDPASLTSGAVVNLRNQITLPRNPATILYDGRDRFGGTKALVVTRTGWAVAPGTVLAGSVEVTATMDYGTQYISPVGQDVSASSMFEVVGLMVMARVNGTSVTVDLNGPVGGGATTVTLNQGESYLVSSGVLKGATVNSTKPVQVQLITGDIGARFETDWFTLYPVDQWTGTYYSPVGTASDGDAAFGFFYNPTAATITINVTTCFGASSFNVPAYGVYQYQMPQNCGAKFISTGEIPFFGIVMVGANPTANNVHDWGFTLVPSDSLTTEAVVGWGPGSSDLTQNGSPVWVTPIAAVRVYVDYNGDRLGALTDPRGNKYDVHYDMSALETRRLFDPDKDQSAMRVYTLDGIQIAAAWGQDPATAGPGNPFLDVGTTVLPFPVPTLIKTHSLATDVAPAGLSIGDTIEYRIDVDNKGLLPLGNLLVLDPLHASLTYQAGTSKRDGNAIADDSVGSTVFPLDETGYLIPIILRGGNTTFTYRCTINAAGSIANTAMNTNYNLTSTENVVVPPPAGSTPCGAQFTNAAGVLQTTYSAGLLVYGTLTDPDANNNAAAVETITIVVNNTSNGDAEFVSLIETGINTGIFRNTAGLPTSTTSGTSQMDGTLLVAPGNSLSFTYTDPEFSETCSGAATISVPTQNKYLYLSDPAQALDRVDPAATSDGTTAQTAVLGPVGGAIAVDATSSSQSANASSQTFAHTVGTGDNRLLLVAIAVGSTSSTGTAATVTSVTYGGNPLTLVGSRVSGSGGANDDAISYIYRLIAPASGTANVVVNLSGAGSIAVGSTSFNNVHQTTPLGAYTSNSNTSGTASVVTTSAADEVVFSTAAWDEGYTITVAGGQTSLWNLTTTGPLSGAASTKPGAASVTSTFTGSAADQDWAVSGVSIKPAPAGGTPTATFIQAPTFASAFTLPVGSAPTVTAHYTVATGTMPPSPTITAVLKKGVTTLATSTGTTASAATGAGVFTFTFASLGSAVNFASTEALTLDITTTQTGTTYTVDYDSTTKPSKITLPTTTVINVDSLGVYDAPYPGGSLITGPASGATAYVRSVVSDPFGAYDITSLGLNIDGPGAPGDITTTLTAPNVVNTGTGTKTYEYAWAVGSTTGTYNIAVTANEGTEGIQATRATSVNVTFLDLGTPSVTEFTTGSNGPGTSTYSGNEQVCVRITDLDQNTDALVAETITATITSLIGDSELVTLTETGVNTGVFVFCIPASTTAPNTFNNGTLHAVLGDVLTVNYVDPTDPTDTGSDTATIPNIAPAISVNKTLVTPADGIAVIGEALQYSLQVTNTGNTTLSTISLVDTFPAADLTFVNASVTPNTIASGSLTWNNVGPLTPGQSTTLTLNFTALTTAAPAVNTATADAGGGTTGGDTANVTITDPKITISKTKTLPLSSTANIGDNVTFSIVVTNTGDTAIATLPVEDTYSGADFEFVSATISPDASGSGSLLWLDVTGAGTLAPGGVITIGVVLKARGAAAPAGNLAAANYTVDVNGDSAPPVSSSASITLVAAKITGHVYDDVNTNVIFDGTDTVLENITVSLYTDPNGDGNPADGTLVDITITDVSGSYEFLNLPTGNYVVVESQPPGYSSSGDTAGANDNRIPVVIATLTTFANRDFFDFLTPLVSYASIAGKVWNDANASATVNGGEVGIANVAVDLVEDTNGNGVADSGEAVVSSTLTATDGTYSFTGLSAGNYVVVEHDLFGWTSTADSAVPNNNMISVAATAGSNTTGRDFLDVLTGTTGGKVFHDVNGNGSFDGGDVALANIDVIITNSIGVSQTVVTDASGNWTATVPPGLTSINVDQTDPQFTAIFVTGYTQTAGTDPNTITAVSSVNTAAGDDGFRLVATVTGHVYLDTNGDGDQDVGEPDLANVDVVITNVDLTTQTVSTNASGNWTATVPPGLTSANINNADPQFTALVLAGNVQTQGTDPNSFIAVANTSTDGGIDGYFNPGTISGSVLADNNNDNTGDAPISGVTLTLVDSAGNPVDGDSGTPGVQIITTTTDLAGAYSFTNLPPGTFGVKETQPGTYLSVSDSDGGDLNEVRPIIVTGGGTSTANFVEELPGAITGTVFAGAALQNVVLTLFTDPNGDGDPTDGVQSGSTALTNLSGVYSFTNVAPGNYVVVQTQPSGYVSVNDGDTTTAGDDVANASPTDNRIPVTITAGETDDGNNFTEGCPTITVSPTTLPNGVVGTLYSQTLSATNGTAPYSYAVTSGTLPTGLSLISDVITGTPTSTVSHNFTITVTDALGCQGARAYTVAPVCPTITVNPASLPNGVVGTAYNQTLTATDGTAPYTFAVTLGALPAGLNLAAGVISGTPTSTAAASFTITATDTYGCTGTRAFTVTPTCPTITVNPTTLAAAVVGTPYNQTLSASDGTAPYTFAVTLGALPAGLNLTAGVISGTPTSAAAASFTITATDTYGCTGSRAFTLTPTCPTISLSSTPAVLPSGTIGMAYNGTIQATGGTSAYTFAVKVGSSLPPGLSISSVGAISGTPTINGTTNAIIVATDAHGCQGEASFTINIGCNTLVVTPASVSSGVVGTAYTPVTFNAAGGTGVITWTHTGALPAGMTFTSAGLLSGTPTEAGSFAITFIATDQNTCAGNVNLTLSTSCPTITVNPVTLANGIVGTAYSQMLSATNGTAPYSYAVTSGVLPAGLNLAAGVISGTPTSITPATFTITATDAHGCTGTRAFTVTPVCPVITVSPASLPNGIVGTAYNQTLTATDGTAPYTFAVTTGALPAGLNLTTGVISGTPTSTTAASFTITATDTYGCTGTRSFTLTPVCPAITVNPASLPNGVVGTAYNQTLTATDGTAPYTFAVTSGALPAGLNLTTGVISGTPTSTAAASFTITATDTYGCTGTRVFTLTPTCPVITVNPASLPNPAIRTAYTQTLSVIGGTAPHTFALTSGALPTGLTLTGDTISGTPTVAASSTFTITATDDYGCEGSRSFTLTVLTGTISGHLYIDTNGDGNQDIGEPNLPNVSMEITESGGATQTVSSDSSGNWTATVPPGDTSSNVDENDSDFGLLVLPGYSQTDGSDQTTGVIVIAGGNVDGGTDGYFNPAFVAGHLYLDLNSNGTQDPGEDNLVDVTVIVTDFEGNMQPAFTDVDGNWQASVPPGSTTVDVDESDPEFQALVLAGYIQTEGDDPTVVTVTGGGMTSAGNDGYFNPATLSGTVFADTDNDGDGDNALENAQVALFTDPNGDGDPADGVQVGLPMLTNSSGVYTFSGITYGDYVIVLLPIADYFAVVDGDTTDAADDHSNVSTTDRRIPVSAMAAETDDGNDFVEEQSASIGNLVWNDADNDGFKDSGESGLDGVVVELRDGSGSPIDSDSGTSGVQPTIKTTSGGGLYSFAGLVPGSYRLVISTPPAAQPMSSTTTSTADNHVDGDDNGTQVMATAPVTSPVIALGAGEVENTIDFGFTTVTGIYSISGQVRDDYDLDGNFSDNDKPVPSVTVKLYADSNGNGVFDAGIDSQIGSTTTNSLGNYQFTSLPAGTYFVQEIDPRPSSSTADAQGANDNLIQVVIAAASSSGNDFLDAVDPAGYIYSSVTGQIIAGGSISVSGPGAVTVLFDGSTGQYSFITDGTSGSYTIAFTPPLGYMIDPSRPVAGASFDPTGGPDPTALGSAENPINAGFLTNHSAPGNPYYLTFALAAGDPLVINNNIPVIEIKPTTFTAWQYTNPLGGQNGVTQDPDGDGLTNLQEFAFCHDPASGINSGCPLKVVKNLDGSIDAQVRRVTGASGITYQLEYIVNLANSGANGAGWTNLTSITPTITPGPGGVETATYANLASVPVLSLGQGFVRVKVTQISDGTVARSEVAGWATRSLILGCQTCSMPFLKCPVFTGAVDGVAGSTLNLASSVGTGNLAGNFTVGREYYVEVIAGDHAGQRFEVNEASSTTTTVVIDTSSPRNTLGSTIPATLAGDRIMVREHHRMKDLFVPADFTSTNSPGTADRLLFHNKNTGAFQVHWLYTNGVGGPKWVDTSDAGLLDSGNRAVDVCEGFFVHLKGHPITFVFTGLVRSNRMACPLVAEANLLGNGWPLDMSPTSRRMRLVDGFIGATSSAGADRVQFWNEDDDSLAAGYTGHFLLNAGSLQRWVGQADASLLNENSANLFNMLRAHFSQPRTPRPNYVIPNPWTP